jgi:hypothetical protein
MHAKNKVLIFDVEDIPQHIYAKMHTANEYHWRPEQGKSPDAPYLTARIALLMKFRSTPTPPKSSASRDTRRYSYRHSMRL